MRPFKHTWILICLLAGLQIPLPAQSMGLEDCIDAAFNENIALRQTELNTRQNEFSYKQSKFAFLPGLNAAMSGNKGLTGRSIDNFSLSIAEQPTNANLGINSSVTVFQGMSRWHTLRQNEYNLGSAEAAYEAMRNDLSLQVAATFFQVVFDRENVAIAEERRQLVTRQLEQMKLKRKAGTATEGDVATLRAQLASEELAYVTAKNQLDSDRLTLFQLMNMRPDDREFRLPDAPDIHGDESKEMPEDIYTQAVEVQPDIRQAELDLLSAEEGVKIARAGSMPTLVVSIGASSFYSSNALNILGYDSNGFPIVGTGNPTFVEQMESNLGVQAALSLNVPIFQQLRIRQTQENAEIARKNAELNQEAVLNDLYARVLRAWQDKESALARYRASSEQVDAVEIAFEYARQRFEAGLLDFYNYMESLNTKSRAQREYVQAKYDYWLKVKILDLYQGREIKL